MGQIRDSVSSISTYDARCPIRNIAIGFNIAVYQYKFIMSLAIVFAVTGLLTDIIKNSVGRLRPDYLSR